MASEPRRFEGPGPPRRNKVTVIYQHTTVPSTASLLPRIGLLTGADRGIVCDRVGPRGTGKACADGDKVTFAKKQDLQTWQMPQKPDAQLPRTTGKGTQHA